MKQKTLIALSLPLLLVLSYLIVSCVHDPNLKGMSPVCFDTQVMPILQSCYSCHDGSTNEGFDATNYGTIFLSVTAFDPKGSTLYKSITDISSENMMPPDKPLSLTDRSIIEVWIAQGAEDIHCDTSSGGNGGGGGTVSKDSICFVQKILPLFNSSCASPPGSALGSCHDGNSQGGEDEAFALTSYPTIRLHLVPKDPLASEVYRTAKGLSGEFMPPQPYQPLSDADLELMKKWIAQGALESDCPDAGCADTSLAVIGFNAVIKPIIKDNCLRCHKTGALGGGINLETYQLVKNCAETIKTGTTNSLLDGTIRHQSGFKAMPYNLPQLDECSIRKIELWVSKGLLENP